MRFGIRIPGCDPVEDVIDFVAEVDRLGFDHAWIPDSQLLWHDVWATLGAASRVTERITLGTNVTNPLTRHPTVTASAARTVADLSGGRFVLGIGSGDSAVRVMGKKTSRVATLRAAVETIRSLVRGEEVEPHGKPVQLISGAARSVPIYVAATGPRMVEMAGAVADGLIYLGGIDAAAVGYVRQHLAAGSAATGRDPAEIDITLGLFCLPTADPPSARLQARPYAAVFALRYQDVLEDYGIDPASVSMPPVWPDIAHARDWEAAVEATSWVPDDVLDKFVERYCVIDTPEGVADRIEEIAGLGIGTLYLRGFSSYSLPREVAATFASVVMPRFG